jgi:hypothetical protein
MLTSSWQKAHNFDSSELGRSVLFWDSLCVIECDAVAINLATEEPECLRFCILRKRWMEEVSRVELERKIVVADRRRASLAVPHIQGHATTLASTEVQHSTLNPPRTALSEEAPLLLFVRRDNTSLKTHFNPS